MKRELALQLLRLTLPEVEWDEDRFQQTFLELEVLADLKYNRYEMYYPGRLFFENLYAWLSKFELDERTAALEFVRQQLIFISREEFQQLAQLVYNDQIRQRQMDLVSTETGIPRFCVRQLSNHATMERIQRSSLYVGMSDGARIDYFRRQNLNISNEQVLPSYEASKEKISSAVRKLRLDTLNESASFECLFLLDDFSASGKTLLREVIKQPVNGGVTLSIPHQLRSRLQFNPESSELEFVYSETHIGEEQGKELRSISSDKAYQTALECILEKNRIRDTELTGSLVRIGKGELFSGLNENAVVFFCPLLITEYALARLKELIPRNPYPHLQKIEILPGAVIPSSVRLTNDSSTANSAVSELCKKYYDPELEDEHTGDVMFGYDQCGLPVVLHHNTPNNSIYMLWARKWGSPLFPRYERHGR